MTPKQCAEYVQNGIQLLNKVLGPEWVTRINIDTLSIALAKQCVLGQLYGEYILGWNKLYFDDGKPTGKPVLNASYTYGFMLQHPSHLAYKEIDKEWKKQLATLVA